jgi:hypothetical protein
MSQAELEFAISSCERPQTPILDRAATGIGIKYFYGMKLIHLM